MSVVRLTKNSRFYTSFNKDKAESSTTVPFKYLKNYIAVPMTKLVEFYERCLIVPTDITTFGLLCEKKVLSGSLVPKI